MSAIEKAPKYEKTTKINERGRADVKSGQIYAINFGNDGCDLCHSLRGFADVRRAEATLIGALATICFALPVLRNALPGSAPLGVTADMWVFLWTELAAVLALVLLVFKWANAGPRPEEDRPPV